MKKRDFKKGNKIIFSGEKIPFLVMASNMFFAVVVRPVNLDEDRDLIERIFKSGAYLSITAAIEDLKDEFVYKCIDFKAEVMGSHNLIFNHYDFKTESDCKDLVNDLTRKKVEVSKRNFEKVTSYKVV